MTDTAFDTAAVIAEALGWPSRPCRHCGNTIVQLDRDAWWHHGRDGGWWRGCRAASFDQTRSPAWDDTLDRRWMADPVRDN